MSDNNERLESEALRLLLDGDDPVLNILRQQLSHMVSTTREHTGAGTYVHFALFDDAPRLPGNPAFTVADVIAEVEGVETGGGFVLFITDGLLDILETFSYDDSWPSMVGEFRVKYSNRDQRDLAALRQTPGWPTALLPNSTLPTSSLFGYLLTIIAWELEIGLFLLHAFTNKKLDPIGHNTLIAIVLSLTTFTWVRGKRDFDRHRLTRGRVALTGFQAFLVTLFFVGVGGVGAWITDRLVGP